MRAANIGKKRSPETSAKIREARLGKKHSPETIAKLRAVNLGKLGVREGIEDAYLIARLAGFNKTESLRIANSSVRGVSL